jgi:hypothetical protein
MFMSDAKARLHSVFDTLWVGGYNAMMEGAVFFALAILIPYICVLIWSESLFRRLERCGNRILALPRSARYRARRSREMRSRHS